MPAKTDPGDDFESSWKRSLMYGRKPDASIVRIAVLGSAGVGKSALTMRLVQKTFNDEYDPTIEDLYTHQLSIGGNTQRIDILDTAGSEQFEGMRDLYLRNAHALMLIFSLDDRASIKALQKMTPSILKVCPQIPCLLVGNKCDLLPNGRHDAFLMEQAGALSKKLDCKAMFNVSAKCDPKSVERAFRALTEEVLHRASPPQEPARKTRAGRKCRIQ